MDADQQAGLAGLAMLVHDLLWWGGLVGALVLVRLSLGAARVERDGATAAGEQPGHARSAVPGAGFVALALAARAPQPPKPVAVPGAGFVALALAARAPQPPRRVAVEETGFVALALAARAPQPPKPVADRLVVIAGATAAASGVHAVMVLGHAGTGWLVPVFFAAAAAVQAWQSWRLLCAPSGALLAGVVAVDVALLMVWAMSRTVGVLGPAEAVGPWDGAVVVWQTICVVVGARMLRGGPRALRPPPHAPQQWGAGAQAALAMTALTLLLLPGLGHG